jgi:pyruvate dehydrogenase E1 component
MYQLKKKAKSSGKKAVQLLGSGAILREVVAAAEILKEQYDIDSDLWSVTSFNELKRDGDDVDRWNLLHPDAEPRRSYVQTCLDKSSNPVIAASDYLKLYADQIRSQLKSSYTVLGTDGFGRSDTRAKLRSFFEVDRYFITLASLDALARENIIDVSVVKSAMSELGIDPEKVNPVSI